MSLHYIASNMNAGESLSFLPASAGARKNAINQQTASI